MKPLDRLREALRTIAVPARSAQAHSPLALALAARAGAAGTAATFAAAALELDTADRAYRAAVARLLPAVKRRAALAALTQFRSRVAAIRERTRATAAYGDFDPLDTYVPAFSGSHAETMRAASAGDAARTEVAALRARVNDELGRLLERSEIEGLTAAKFRRNAAFDRSVRAALPREAGDKLATQLLLLIDGWY